VTHDGIRLPIEPYRHVSARLYPIHGVTGYPPAPGREWHSAPLRNGIEALRQIGPHLDRLGALKISAIDVTEVGGRKSCVVLRTAHGIPVRWGRPLAPVGENSVEQKVRFLLAALPDLDRLLGYQIDVRYDRIFLRKSTEP
jgi:hypothetical protein